MTLYKQPVSVLVVIYTAAASDMGQAAPANSGQAGEMQVLLLERADHPGYWQSVTGSVEAGETLPQTALREVREETGIDAAQYQLTDWHTQNIYEIYPHWRHRYAPGITHNTEHVFGLKLDYPVQVELSPREHLRYRWWPWREAAERVFSPSNREAIMRLAVNK